jgi:hypothetical protein
MCKKDCYNCTYSMITKDQKLWCSEKDKIVQEDDCCTDYKE